MQKTMRTPLKKTVRTDKFSNVENYKINIQNELRLYKLMINYLKNKTKYSHIYTKEY